MSVCVCVYMTESLSLSHNSKMTSTYSYYSINGEVCILKTKDTDDYTLLSCATLDINRFKHSFNDLPATIYTTIDYTSYTWYKHGDIHRDNDKPAFIYKSNTPHSFMKLIWVVDGKFHRDNDDQPACIIDDEDDANYNWYKNDRLHRDNDKPAKVAVNKKTGRFILQKWYQQGEEHRQLGKPSSITLDEVRYIHHGRLVRYSGLARVSLNGELSWLYEITSANPNGRKDGNIISYCALLNCIKRVKDRLRKKKKEQLLLATPVLDNSMVDEIINQI